MLELLARNSPPADADAGVHPTGPAPQARPSRDPIQDRDDDDTGDDDTGDGDFGDGHGEGGGGGGEGGGGGGRDKRWVTVAAFSVSTQAHMARLRLEGEEIDCVLVDEHLITTNWLLSPAIGGIKLQVPHDQADLAREILGADAIAWDEAEALEHARCSRCGTGEYELAPLPAWAVGVSVLLLGIPLLFLPRRWRCDRCGALMQ